MSLNIIPIRRSKKNLKEFLKLPWKIYEGDRNWVPPLVSETKAMLNICRKPEEQRGEQELFLILKDGQPAGRICVGVDTELNIKKNLRRGYFCLFECIHDFEAAKLLFDTAQSWLKVRKISSIRGPVLSVGGDGDDYKGLLVDCFDRPPVVLTSYNPEYYREFMEMYGFKKDLDIYAYLVEPEGIFSEDTGKKIEYAMNRYNYRVETINLSDIDKEARDIKYIIDRAMPNEWADLVPPSLKEIKAAMKKLRPVADPALAAIARAGDQPIGFGFAVPDYNQVLIHLNGKINLFSILKFLWYKRKINCARFTTMFVIPSFRKKGVSYSIYYKIFQDAMQKGYKWGEGSTIGEPNKSMRRDIENLGGRRYKTYRIYSKDLSDD